MFVAKPITTTNKTKKKDKKSNFNDIEISKASQLLELIKKLKQVVEEYKNISLIVYTKKPSQKDKKKTNCERIPR
jgi:hypothetical protein